MTIILGNISVSFKCKTCGAETETVSFFPKGHPSNKFSSDVINYNHGSETTVLSAKEAEKLKRALASNDPEALYSAHHRWLATYCPQCRACFCKQHWFFESHPDLKSDPFLMHFDTYATCPSGHRRLVDKDSYYWEEDE